ncbi:hypothetical protein [Dietzia sp. 179-F 9C3 NHS]|uniref:hypothetical protein n=1 Tax=Dietzia sp. 179-F 9C3 NHS TaxID=3374295 RepID=UPI00387A18E1
MASDKALTLQARANMLLCDNTDAFFAGVRLLSLMKELQRLSKAVRPHEIQPGTRHVFEWLEQVQITREYYVLTPQHAAILLNSLMPIVNCRHFDEEIRRNLRVLCERRVNQDGREESVVLARRQALEEIASLLLIGKRIAWLVDVHGLHEDDVPTIFIGKRDKVRHTLQSQDWWGRQGAPGMWNALRQSCNDVHEAVAAYRMGPGSQAQSVLKAAQRARPSIGPTGGSPITPTRFAVELTQLLGHRRTRGARPGRIGLPGPAVKWLVPEIEASPGMRDVLEDWLWLQTLEPGPELRSDGVVPLEEIWRLDAQMTVEQKLQLLELRDSVIDDVEGRSRERFPEESTGSGTRQVQRGQHRAG